MTKPGLLEYRLLCSQSAVPGEQAHSLGTALNIVKLAEYGDAEEMKVLRPKHR